MPSPALRPTRHERGVAACFAVQSVYNRYYTRATVVGVPILPVLGVRVSY